MVRDDDDRRSLLQLLRDAAAQHGVALHAYAVLDGRFDLIATPQQAAGLSRLMQAVARRHASAFNRRYQRTGGLWEGRFRAAVIEPESWLLKCMVYAEQLTPAQTSREGGSAVDGAWSSRAGHCGQAADSLLTDPLAYWLLGNTPFEREAAYRVLCEQALTSAEIDRIEGSLRGGGVLGGSAFTERLRQSVGRPVRPRPRGRPRKAVTA
ncbi:transposase [Methylibium sp.]|uniref:transposase n=1 Tax=Methylibium sp. TaxID=2067992 RepID=UPI0025EA5393|nr:transposase [Methylibium sp.]